MLKRKEYNKQKAELVAKIELVTTELEAATETNGASLNGASWNDLHDLKDDLEDELDTIESQWRTRNWSAADWTSYNLMANNID